MCIGVVGIVRSCHHVGTSRTAVIGIFKLNMLRMIFEIQNCVTILHQTNMLQSNQAHSVASIIAEISANWAPRRFIQRSNNRNFFLPDCICGYFLFNPTAKCAVRPSHVKWRLFTFCATGQGFTHVAPRKQLHFNMANPNWPRSFRSECINTDCWILQSPQTIRK